MKDNTESKDVKSIITLSHPFVNPGKVSRILPYVLKAFQITASLSMFGVSLYILSQLILLRNMHSFPIPDVFGKKYETLLSFTEIVTLLFLISGVIFVSMQIISDRQRLDYIEKTHNEHTFLNKEHDNNQDNESSEENAIKTKKIKSHAKKLQMLGYCAVLFEAFGCALSCLSSIMALLDRYAGTHIEKPFSCFYGLPSMIGFIGTASFLVGAVVAIFGNIYLNKKSSQLKSDFEGKERPEFAQGPVMPFLFLICGGLCMTSGKFFLIHFKKSSEFIESGVQDIIGTTLRCLGGLFLASFFIVLLVQHCLANFQGSHSQIPDTKFLPLNVEKPLANQDGPKLD